MAALIVLVEDDLYVRDSFAVLLQSWGYLVSAFESAEAFLAVLPTLRPDCVICDLRLGGIDGLELLAQLREREPPLPVILISAHADVSQAVRAMQLGASTVLEKPIAEEALRSSLSRALHNRRPFTIAPVAGQAGQLHELRRRRDSLTLEEASVLEGLLAGKQNKQIAGDLKIGLRTAELRRATVMKKMGADSLAQLIRLVLLLNNAPREQLGG